MTKGWHRIMVVGGGPIMGGMALFAPIMGGMALFAPIMGGMALCATVLACGSILDTSKNTLPGSDY